MRPQAGAGANCQTELGSQKWAARSAAHFWEPVPCRYGISDLSRERAIMRAMRTFYPLLFGAALALAASPSFAQGADDAETHFNRGVELLDAGKHEEACEAFRKSNALETSMASG